MYDILQLNDMIVPELLDIAEQLKIPNAKKMDKQELVYKILDNQAIAGAKTGAASGDAKNRQRKRIVKATTGNTTEEAIVESNDKKPAHKKVHVAKKEEKPIPKKATGRKKEEVEDDMTEDFTPGEEDIELPETAEAQEIISDNGTTEEGQPTGCGRGSRRDSRKRRRATVR